MNDDQDKLSQIERHLQNIADRLFMMHMILGFTFLALLGIAVSSCARS